MLVTSKNEKIQAFMTVNKRDDGQIAEGVYIAMQCRCETGELVRLWLGTPELGPMLGYTEPSEKNEWHGLSHQRNSSGWTPIYSRGNYGKNCACGGNWSGHCRGLISSRLIGSRGRGDKKCEIIMEGNIVQSLSPDIARLGIEGDATLHDLDCSGSWTVFYESATRAARERLTLAELAEAKLPQMTIQHLSGGMYNIAWGRVYELVSIFNI